MSISEGILTNGVTEILNKLLPVVGREIGLAWGVKDELKKLRDTLQMILAVIADAEKKQQNDAAVGLWLRRLKDIAYDADDVMVEFSYETMRRSERGNNLKYKARDFFSYANNPLAFCFKMAREIKHINQRLDAITEDMRRFQLQITPATDTTISHGESSDQRSRQTESSVSQSDIMGREDDAKRIIDMLTSCDSNPEKVSAVSIVGMGGLGKTTLAQLVYNDELVNEQFKLRMWVHVSEDFDVEKLLTKIMESSTQVMFDTLSNFDVLASKVREQLKGKKFLLVLDDLWNEHDELWEKLRSPLLVGAQGSKILITTRKTQVADVVKGSIPPYKLKGLRNDECWSIIEKKAFYPGGAIKTEKMTDIGLKIARKCCGLPLAAKFLGSLMRTRNREVDWLSIQKNDIESQNRVIAILKWSYDNLSSQLKQCFSYCSIFPKGWNINRETLVQLWIAEGFLDTCNVGNGSSIEDIAGECFESLVWSSFLEGIGKSLLGETTLCTMHDLVHDLAQSVAGDQELVSFKVSELKNISEIRRLQLILDADLSTTFLERLTSANKLRTLFIAEGSKVYPDIFLGNQHLRILHIGRSPKFSFAKLPSLSFNKLRHLRYLHLTSLDIRKVANNLDCISRFYNLETLELSFMRCSIENLLRNIHSLKKLRHLNITRTKIEELPDSVTSLYNLQTLDISYCKLKFLPESVTRLQNLRLLDISYNLIEELPCFIIKLGNLQQLNVGGCKNLKSLPDLVKILDKLKLFDFQGCPLLTKMPEDFGALTQLRFLNLMDTGIKLLPESCANLVNLEFVYLSNCELPKEVHNWTRLRRFNSNRKETPLGMKKLVLLEDLIYWVREKRSDGTNHNDGIEELESLNNLEELRINNLHNVKDSVEAERANFKGKLSLRELTLAWDEVEESSDMLWDQNSCNFQVFEALQPHTGLRKLQIIKFMGCDLPTWMCVPTGLPSLKSLDLIGCNGLRQLPEAIWHLQHLTHLGLYELMSLKSFDIGGFPSLSRLYLSSMFYLEEMCCSHPCPSLQYLSIDNSKELTEIPSLPSLKELMLRGINHQFIISSVGRTLTSLTSLHFEFVEELVYFPYNILQSNCNLRTLRIWWCSKFQGFQVSEGQENENEVTLHRSELHSGSLQKLVLEDCPVLKFLPDLRGWTSLQKLTIWNCPEVKKCLTYDLKSLSFLEGLYVDFIQRDEQEEQQEDLSNVFQLINLLE